MAEYYDPQTYPKEWNYLQTGTIIDQYVIERELAHGGFSSVYLARQVHDQFQVAIKEYLPRKFAHRTWNNKVVANSEEAATLFKRGRVLFFEEAKVLSTLKHPNIVEVIGFFKANSTVYMVMTYDYGVTLDKLLRNKSLSVSEDFLLTLFNSLLAGLGHIHSQQYIHLDIKPSNILVRPGNDALLLDFGAIQSFPKSHLGKQSKVLTKGYSPIEQHDLSAQLGPWTDIYAVGASMRSCLENKAPVPAQDRARQDTLVPAVKAFNKKFPQHLLEAIDWAMALQPENRPQSVAELQQALAG
ncbi:MAG: serine/threonine protein kinase [Methylobacter sp.]|jgi:serine/threonine protein kinase|uniref:serine/threonine protein kinase n=1 Tax=Methylobacter sp. TaxID=2051955 RepID=UPI0025D150DC|nr:serine/threonine-protein kinase [Methylobacter sp.]MCK9619570.1 serine/threonine protein kinase [Methylobacter sp.]